VYVTEAVAHLDEESKVGEHSQPATTINQSGGCCKQGYHIMVSHFAMHYSH